jgi:hypothetical protein
MKFPGQVQVNLAMKPIRKRYLEKGQNKRKNGYT